MKLMFYSGRYLHEFDKLFRDETSSLAQFDAYFSKNTSSKPNVFPPRDLTLSLDESSAINLYRLVLMRLDTLKCVLLTMFLRKRHLDTI